MFDFVAAVAIAVVAVTAAGIAAVDLVPDSGLVPEAAVGTAEAVDLTGCPPIIFQSTRAKVENEKPLSSACHFMAYMHVHQQSIPHNYASAVPTRFPFLLGYHGAKDQLMQTVQVPNRGASTFLLTLQTPTS